MSLKKNIQKNFEKQSFAIRVAKTSSAVGLNAIGIFMRGTKSVGIVMYVWQ
jgi:hypothetical protein